VHVVVMVYAIVIVVMVNEWHQQMNQLRPLQQLVVFVECDEHDVLGLEYVNVNMIVTNETLIVIADYKIKASTYEFGFEGWTDTMG
jgi:hypothetical protein